VIRNENGIWADNAVGITPKDNPDFTPGLAVARFIALKFQFTYQIGIDRSMNIPWRRHDDEPPIIQFVLHGAGRQLVGQRRQVGNGE